MLYDKDKTNTNKYKRPQVKKKVNNLTSPFESPTCIIRHRRGLNYGGSLK
jgi:hypothetical protein